jgi:hypothetical protein
MREHPEKGLKGSSNAAHQSDGDDVQLSRRMFIKASWLIPPAVLASFTVSRPVFAATCTPNLCDPGDQCIPDLCGPQICTQAPTP